jgi:hypothetical protein
MDEQQIRAIIQDELEKYATGNQFGVSRIPTHNHTGVDSPQIDGNNLDFAQLIFKLPNSPTVPTQAITGAISVVGGILYIYNGTAWVKVGTQV